MSSDVWNVAQFQKDLEEVTKRFNRKRAGELCDNLISHLYRSGDPYPKEQAEKILDILRRKCWFREMQKVADAMILSGRSTPKIRRQYAQSLIDQEILVAAISILTDIRLETEKEPKDPKENVEARGLLGRAYKQIYVNAKSSTNKRNRNALQQAARYYYDVYASDPDVHIWPGINVVALLKRAQRDKVPLDGFPDAANLAEDILGKINALDDYRVSTWESATALEASIAMDEADGAQQWAEKYVQYPPTDTFEISSLRRQLREIWQIDESNSEVGKRILPILEAALLEREGGRIEVDPVMMREELPKQPAIDHALERVFGADSFQSLTWYRTGLERLSAVARIGIEAARGFGTGFLVKGSDLHPKFGDEPVLVTNSHVLSDDPSVGGAIRSSDAVIVFEALGPDEYAVDEILYSSPPHEFDATVVRLAGKQPISEDPKLKDVKFYPIARKLPLADGNQRVYVIGYPGGGGLSISLQDNVLLGYRDKLVHYRAPTEGGSSGSPVFNRKWELVALHHKGDSDMPRIDGKAGTYEANEGIWIQAIKEGLSEAL
ncbi:MAG: serine protease [Blastocatellia bacterium]